MIDKYYLILNALYIFSLLKIIIVNSSIHLYFFKIQKEKRWIIRLTDNRFIKWIVKKCLINCFYGSKDSIKVIA